MQNDYRGRLRDFLLPLAAAAAIVLGSIGGCGIKGPLRLPPPAQGGAAASTSSGATTAPAGAPTQSPEAMPAEPPAAPAESTDKRKP